MSTLRIKPKYFAYLQIKEELDIARKYPPTPGVDEDTREGLVSALEIVSFYFNILSEKERMGVLDDLPGRKSVTDGDRSGIR